MEKRLQDQTPIQRRHFDECAPFANHEAMNTPQNRATVTRVLEEVQQLCLQNRALVLTESDLKSLIYSKLSAVPEFGNLVPTYNNGPLGNAVHSETKFFDANGLLRQAPDLVLVDPSQLSIVESIGGGPPTAKQFNFVGNPILIELKFLRHQRIPNTSILATIRDDIMKGHMLGRRQLPFHMFVAVFDRFQFGQDRVNNLFNEERQTQGIDPNYVTAIYYPGGPPLRPEQ